MANTIFLAYLYGLDISSVFTVLGIGNNMRLQYDSGF